MAQPKKKKVSKKKVKPRQEVKLTKKKLNKFIQSNGLDSRDKLPEGYKYGAYHGSDPEFG